MNETELVLLFLAGLLLLFPVCLGIWGFSEWVAKQIKARQDRPRLEAQAATKLADAERKLEEARIRRLELELGIAPPAIDDAKADR